jgi:hypothetical protein
MEPLLTRIEKYVVPHDPEQQRQDDEQDLKDLNQKDISSYIVTEKGLTLLQNNSNVVNVGKLQLVTRTIGFHLPPFLCQDLWRFYRLPLEQIFDMINSYSPLALWSLCLFLRLNLCTPAVKPSYANSIGAICAAKAQVTERLEEFIKKYYKEHVPLYQQSRYPEDDHKPQLPVFEVPMSVIQTLTPYIPSKSLYEAIPLRHPIPFTSCFQIRGRKYIPYELHLPDDQEHERSSESSHRQYILLVRIVSVFTYITTYGVPECVSLDPIYVTLKDQKGYDKLYCSIDEMIYLTPSRRQPSLSSSPFLSQESFLKLRGSKRKKKNKPVKTRITRRYGSSVKPSRKRKKSPVGAKSNQDM